MTSRDPQNGRAHGGGGVFLRGEALCGTHARPPITLMDVPIPTERVCVECGRNPIDQEKYQLCEECMDIKTEEWEDGHTDHACLTDEDIRRIQARKMHLQDRKAATV